MVTRRNSTTIVHAADRWPFFLFLLLCLGQFALTFSCPLYDHYFISKSNSSNFENAGSDVHFHSLERYYGDRVHHRSSQLDSNAAIMTNYTNFEYPQRQLRKGFSPCGTPDPSREEKFAMGLAHALWDEEYDLDDDHGNENNQNDTASYRDLGSRALRRRRHRRSHKRQQQLVILQPIKKKAPAKIVVPTYFHVFQKTAKFGRVSRTEIENGLLAVLNQEYSSVSPFVFELRGISRTINSKWFACQDELNYKRSNRRGGPESLNIFICDTVNGLNLGGNSYLPPVLTTEWADLDGVNLMNSALGGASYARQALVHEVGHWLGLMHTFSEGCSGRSYSYYNFPDYYFDGDGVADTPAHSLPTSSVTAHSFCWQHDHLDTCRNNRPAVDKGLDPINNYMNYLPGICFEKFATFTRGQVKRMVAQYTKFRAPGNKFD